MKLDIEKADQYIFGQLNAKDLNEFEQSLKTDGEFASEFDIHKLTIEGIQTQGNQRFLHLLSDVDESLDRKGFFGDQEDLQIIESLNTKGNLDFMDTLKDVDAKFKTSETSDNEGKSTQKGAKLFKMPARRILAMAASFAAVVLLAWMFWPSQPQSNQLYSNYYKAVPETISPLIRAEKAELGFTNPSYDLLNQLETAILLYEQKDYTAFRLKVENLIDQPSLGDYKDELVLYYGISHMEEKDFDSALEAFQTMDIISPTIQWNSALALVKLERMEEAKSILKEIDTEDQALQIHVDELLKILD